MCTAALNATEIARHGCASPSTYTFQDRSEATKNLGDNASRMEFAQAVSAGLG
jgi:hypothetical protein